MARLTPGELATTSNVAKSAAALGIAAAQFRSSLQAVTDTAGARAIGLSFHDSETEVALNFRIGTAHGLVEALFDHAFRGNELIGRYRFFAMTTLATGDVAGEQVWEVLFRDDFTAFWEPTDLTGWYFGAGDPSAGGLAGEFLLTLVARLQARLPRY